jgi:hypothetical protein
MHVEFTWSKWTLMFTQQQTPSGIDKWLTVGPLHVRWTRKD